jgi:uncharacterized membrane protein YfcA
MLVLAVTMCLPDRQRLIKKSQYHKTCKEVHGDQVCFLLPKNKVPMMSLAGLGGIFMGLISVGIGEINEFLFVKRFKIHSGIAAGTSVLIVALTAISGAVTHGIHLASHATLSQLNQIFSVVIFCAPGAVLGAQVGVRVSRLIPENMVKYLLVGIFLLIAGLTLGKLLMP